MPFEQLIRRSSQAILSSVTSHRILVYGLLSTLTVLATIGNALKNHSNFYSVTIYLSKSSRSILVLANFTFLLALIGGYIVQKIFFGSLRPNEVERLYERLWFFITESLLAFTIFRDEFDILFALMFGFLLFVKSFHWLANDRVEWMDQRPYPGPPLLFHVRMSVLFVILWTTDLLMFLVAVENTLAHGVTSQILFASEYGILMATVTNTISKYLLSAYDFRRAGQRGGEVAPPWENKSMWVFYIELATDFFKLTIYLVFFTIIITFYGLPLNIVRDVYITARSFISRLRALHRYQTATRNMDQRYPNATEEEMTAMSDRTCIICREEMLLQRPGTPAAEGPNMTPKKLPCGHIFHFYCLRSWLERQQSCPTCRRTVLDNNHLERQADAGRNNPVVPGPQPPGVPQNMPAEMGAQNPAVPGNNPLGLMGRFFGVQGQPARPINGGQLPNFAAQPGGIIIQYNVHYQGQPPADGQQPEAPTQSGNLQPAPQFHGLQNIGDHLQDGSKRSTSQSPSSSGLAPQPEAESVSPNELNPREAAARAAARRTNSRGDPGSSLSSQELATPAHGYDAGSQTASSSSQPLAAPALIPLLELDFESLGPTPERRPDSLHSSQVTGHPPIRGNERVPISPLMTDEQLALMDQTTREAIDERLKVLEGVSTAVYRCIDDLMKMRSALPPVGSAQFHVDTEAALAESDSDTPVSVEQNEAFV